MDRRTLGIRENIRLALRGITTHKMRSFLTMLGIIIGIAAIIAIVSIIKGTNEQIKQNLIGSGSNTVTVNLNQGDYAYEFQYNGIPEGVYPIDQEALNDISKLNHVTSVSKFLKRNYADQVSHGANSLNGGSVIGIDGSYLSTSQMEVIKGRGITDHDVKNYRKVILVDGMASQSLFYGEDPIGKTIEIMGEPFTVVGMIQPRTSFVPVIETPQDYYLYYPQESGTVYIPLSVWPIMYQFDEPESVMIGIDQTDAMTEVGQKAAEILNANIHPQDESIQYQAEDLLKQAQQLQQLSKSTNMMLIWIAAISLLVGGIGVMNIMLVSVTERTREIGLKKALGARRSSILFQFLTEAAALTSIGGVLGIILGVILAYVIHLVAMVPMAISGLAIIVSFIFSAVVGIVFGLLPSIKASKLDPIEALRYE